MPGKSMLGDFIRRRRLELNNMTQADLTQRLNQLGFGYSVQTVGHWETGRAAVPLDQTQETRGEEITFLAALSSALEVSPLRVLAAAGYLNPADLKFDVETYEFAQLFESASPSQRKIVKQLLEEFIGSQ